MVNGVSASSQVSQWQVQQQQQQQQQHVPAKHAKAAEKQDSVVLSKQAQAAADPDHDGD